MDLSKLLADVNNFVWGPVMLVLLVGTGIFLTVRLKFLPWRNLGYAIHMVFSKRDKHAGDISPFQSLMTALSATIGTGNIVGVATAMVLGGPGALVWMWISAAFGLSTKYGESVLAVKYRETNSVGEMAGGPMYAMKNGILCYNVVTEIHHSRYRQAAVICVSETRVVMFFRLQLHVATNILFLIDTPTKRIKLSKLWLRNRGVEGERQLVMRIEGEACMQ